MQSVRYNLYISNSREQLQRAVMCQMTPLTNVISVQVNSTKVGDSVAPQLEVNLEVNFRPILEKENQRCVQE